MQKLHNTTRGFLLSFIDLLYPLFKKFMPLQTFRYAACGGFNTSLDITVFFVSYNYIFKAQPISFPSIFPNLIISAHIAAFLTGFLVTFPTGFYLSRYVVFQETSVKKSKQLFKYFSVVLFCLVLNYGFLKLFIDTFRWSPLPSKLLTTVFVVAFSYVAQKNFTFTPNSRGETAN
ncbi:GtrA family protein [Parasediminibacterium sp. JCM 36343]|uniref:GtrA family protein n=1 Tax=Parasediminibacterium sp. JCM 36343 TaxID=3374279 RepID=UPI00397C6539